MRWVAILLVLGLLMTIVPTASAANLPAPRVSVTYAVDAPGKGCLDCFGANAGVAVLPPNGCMDCPGYFAGAGASNDPDTTAAHAWVCQGGFFYICWVDEAIEAHH